jgi:hypothetical protein
MNKNEEYLPYYELAMSKLDYNSETGVFTWKFKAGSAKNGKVAGTIRPDKHRQISQSINGKRKLLLAHRLAWYMNHGVLPKQQIDHIDQKTPNNAISNLRPCTNSQNNMNKGKQENNTSGFRGVSWIKQRQKWQAQIRINGRLKYLGAFTTPQEASAVYEAKSKELFGEFYNRQ